eukprot:CAMPEP_0172479422 /NCGR_PEP_ID=MMETSP1066-20121228/3982_1 /TAXON_ID=671091 /ORGANISM="Coscinodiscus wailesii, Strain CCMP2513" /LENGTH=43 /DNA_ID= /DNA_START= /DNA_END= /DNA_ORIENTATION=
MKEITTAFETLKNSSRPDPCSVDFVTWITHYCGTPAANDKAGT